MSTTPARMEEGRIIAGLLRRGSIERAVKLAARGAHNPAQYLVTPRGKLADRQQWTKPLLQERD